MADIKYHLDVIKTTDWIISLGPDSGDAGGRIVAQGIPEAVVDAEELYTGSNLRRVLHNN